MCLGTPNQGTTTHILLNNGMVFIELNINEKWESENCSCGYLVSFASSLASSQSRSSSFAPEILEKLRNSPLGDMLGWVFSTTRWWWFDSAAMFERWLVAHLAICPNCSPLAVHTQTPLNLQNCELVLNQWNSWKGFRVKWVHTLKQTHSVIASTCLELVWVCGVAFLDLFLWSCGALAFLSSTYRDGENPGHRADRSVTVVKQETP